MVEVPIYRPELPPYDKVEPELREMYQSGFLYPGKFTKRLENRLAEEMEVPHVQAVSSCSLGLMMLLSILPEGTEVILPTFTFNATLQAIEWNRLIPVTVDVDENGQLDPNQVDAVLTWERHNVSAILAVHLWGNACHPEDFEAIGSKFGLKIFFDGAHNLGTLYKGQHISRFGDATVHSIAATKPISAGEGGIFVTKDASLAIEFADVAAHGLYGTLDTRLKGTNGKIQEFNSILAYHALDNAVKTKSRRAHLMDIYRRELSGLPLRIWENVPDVDPMYKDCTIFLEDPRVRQDLERYLNERGIGTKRYFDPPVPEMGSFRGRVAGSVTYNHYPVAKKLSQTCLNLPLYPALTDGEQFLVIGEIQSFFQRG